MNELVFDLLSKSKVSAMSPRVFHGNIDIEKFAELVARECMKVCDLKLSESFDRFDEYELGIREGLRRSKESIEFHFGIDIKDWQKVQFEELE